MRGSPRFAGDCSWLPLILPMHLREINFAFLTVALPFISAKDLRLHALRPFRAFHVHARHIGAAISGTPS